MKNSLKILILLLLIHRGEAANEENKPTSLIAALPSPVWKLFNWPDTAIIKGEKAIAPDAPIAIVSGRQSWLWINQVVDTAWLPPENTLMHFIAKEFDDRDVTHVEWTHGKYRVEVSQTASIFSMKLMLQEAGNVGDNSDLRYNIARQLCRQIFKREGRMWSQNARGEGVPVVIPEINEKIMAFSFDVAKTKQLSADKVVVGEAKSMEDEGIDASTRYQVVPVGVAPNERSPEAWNYWFRNVNWWNDGKAVGFYFLKIEGSSAWVPSFIGEIDKNWFRVPRDRSGRPIGTQSK